MEPRIQYAKTSDGVNIAYYALGEGPPLMAIGSTTGHLQLEWELLRGLWEGIAQRWTLVRYDRRGCGLSERDVSDFSVGALARDLEAVADRLELETFRLVALGLDAAPAIAYAAAHPERVSHLVLWHAFARGADWWDQQNDALLELVQKDWNAGTDAWVLAGLGWTGFGRVSAELWRAAMTPETYTLYLHHVREWDITDLLPSLAMPTLVMHRRENPWLKVNVATNLAAAMPDARLVLLEGSGPMGPDGTARVQEFLAPDEPLEAQAASRRLRGRASRDFSLVTILFTDLASSTAFTQRLGDAKAQELVRAHNAIVREALAAHGGSEVKHTATASWLRSHLPVVRSSARCASSGRSPPEPTSLPFEYASA